MCHCQLQALCIPAPPLHTVPAPATPALPIPPGEPGTIQQGTPVTELISSGFAYATDAKSLGLGLGFELLWLDLHAAPLDESL